jgi:hypothetical protein
MVSYTAPRSRRPDHGDLASDKTVCLGFLSDEELDGFTLLIDQRRSLPAFLGDCWRCYACIFECTDLLAMVEHILQAHEPEPFNKEDGRE